MSSQQTNASTTPSLSCSTPSTLEQPGQTVTNKDSNSNNRYSQSQTNGYYPSEGDKFLSNEQMYCNTSTDALYNQLKVHTELAYRAATEAFARRKQEYTEFKEKYCKKIEEQKREYEKQLKQQNEKNQEEYNRLKNDTEIKIKNLEIQLAERVAAQNALEKSNKEKYDALNCQLSEKTLRINKIETDYEELQRKYTELQKEKQALQHEHDNLNEQVNRIKSMMMGVGSNKKRRITEIL